MLAEMVKKAERAEAGIRDPFEQHRKRPLAEHLADWATSLLADGATAKHVKQTLACATEAAEKPRFRSLPARNLTQLAQEIAKAKQRFGLPPEAPVCTCYEAGRDGFWLHRALTRLGIGNVVVDSGAIEVNRRRKHAKTDPIDAAKLVNLMSRVIL